MSDIKDELNSNNNFNSLNNNNINEQDINNIERQLEEDELIKVSLYDYRYNQILKEIEKINKKIKNNKIKIEEIKQYLIKLKEEKNKQQKDIINLLSKKESIEEIYKNQISFLAKKNSSTNLNKPTQKFIISLEEFKKLEIDKFIEQVISMTDDLLENCTPVINQKNDSNYDRKDIISNLKNIIYNSYEIFCNNSSISNSENIIDNFIIKISLFLSNQSFGKYSDKEINIFLRYLIKINVISSDITKMGKFINKQYKEKKEELKNKIKNLEKKNDIYMKQLKEGKKIKEDIKNNPNNELFLENFNFNINNKKENNLNKNDSLKFNNETDLIDKNINKTIFEEKFDSNKNKKDLEFSSNKNNINIETNINENKNGKKSNAKEKHEDSKDKSSSNRIIKGKKIKRGILYHVDGKNENNNKSDEDSFYKNVNCDSEDESDIINNSIHSKQESDINEISSDEKIDLFNKENLEYKLNEIEKSDLFINGNKNKKKRIQEIIDEMNNSNMKENINHNIKVYNKKNIKFINKKIVDKNKKDENYELNNINDENNNKDEDKQKNNEFKDKILNKKLISNDNIFHLNNKKSGIQNLNTDIIMNNNPEKKCLNGNEGKKNKEKEINPNLDNNGQNEKINIVEKEYTFISQNDIKNKGILNTKNIKSKNNINKKNIKINIDKNDRNNNRSFDSIFTGSNQIFNKKKNNEGNQIIKLKKFKSPTLLNKNYLKITEQKNNNKKDIYFNKKKKGCFSKSKIIQSNQISLTEANNINNPNIKVNIKKDINIINDEIKIKNEKNDAIKDKGELINNQNNNSKNKIKINKNEIISKNIIKMLKRDLIKNQENNKNIKTEKNDNDYDNKKNIILNNNLAENIINNLLNPKNNQINYNNSNLLSYFNKKDINENLENKNLEKYMTGKELIRNNINNNNEITLPISNQPISNRISKLNLNIFITQNKDNNSRVLPQISNMNILKKDDCNSNGNHERQNEFNYNGIENDNVINGLCREDFINKEDNINNEEKSEITNKFRKIQLNKKIYNDRNRILLNNKYLSSNNRYKTTKKISQTLNTVDDQRDYNKKKDKLKNQYSLFYNTHDFNNNDRDYSNKNSRKVNKLLIKNLSNLKENKNDKKKLKTTTDNNPKYIELSYLNKFNNNLLKSQNNNSYSLNEDKFFKSNNIKNNNKGNHNVIKNQNKNNKKIKFISNKSGVFNYTFNTRDSNLDSISSTKNKMNRKFINTKTYDINKNKDNNKNNLKKLLEKNLPNISPYTKLHFNPKKIFSEGIMESFCYFKILDKESPKFNPLDSCTINPDALGYSEGYISLDVILGHFKIIPKHSMSPNIENKNKFLVHNNCLSFVENNGKNIFNIEKENEEINCIRIELKEINGIKISKIMQDIIKIHKIFLKYNSHSGYEYEDGNGRIKRRVLSINKLLYMKEVSEINMDQNEKIKAALCNFFVFTIIFGDYKVNKVECIFINYELFNIWQKCLEMIAQNNNKSKNSLISYRGLFHRKFYSNNYYSNNRKSSNEE